MIKRSTWLLLFILVLVLGAYLYLRYRPVKESPVPTPTTTGNNFLISEESGKLQSIRIDQGPSKAVLIERDPSSRWSVSLPASGVADQALAEMAETQVSALRIVTKLETAPQLSALGLEIPGSKISLTFTNGVQHIIEIGSMTPTGSGYYVRLDGGGIYVVSQSAIEALLNLLDNPPYMATETPVPPLIPTPSPFPFTPTPQSGCC